MNVLRQELGSNNDYDQQPSELEPADVPGDEYSPVKRPRTTTIKTLRAFALLALLIYGGGVVYSHLVYSQDDRAACYRAGGLLGRIWCPESVDTEGFRVHFVKALGWPAQIARNAAAPADNFEKSVAAAKHIDQADSIQQRAEEARASISKAQKLLNTLGYKIGNPDGVVGPRTRAAISDFQLRDGMQVSGEVTPELVGRLENSVRNGKFDAMENK